MSLIKFASNTFTFSDKSGEHQKEERVPTADKALGDGVCSETGGRNGGSHC